MRLVLLRHDVERMPYPVPMHEIFNNVPGQRHPVVVWRGRAVVEEGMVWCFPNQESHKIDVSSKKCWAALTDGCRCVVPLSGYIDWDEDAPAVEARSDGQRMDLARGRFFYPLDVPFVAGLHYPEKSANHFSSFKPQRFQLVVAKAVPLTLAPEHHRTWLAGPTDEALGLLAAAASAPLAPANRRRLAYFAESDKSNNPERFRPVTLWEGSKPRPKKSPRA